mgnify:CR=1 FL=1
MKIFWRIFMRQISLTDYFCKGLKIHEKAEFFKTTSADMNESHIQNVQVTKEAPN